MLYHVWSRYTPTDAETTRRMALAAASWAKLRWVDRGLTDAELPRVFVEGPRRFPYVRDLFDTGARGLALDDIIIFTNADIGMASQSDVRIALMLQRNEAGYGNRRDFGHRLTELPTEAQIAGAASYCGTDLFFFRVRWWNAFRHEWPDMVLGREAWDACLRVLMEATCDNKPLSMDGLCWHERHGGTAYWEHPQNRYTLPGQRHNLDLAKKFVRRYGHSPVEFGIR